MICAIFFFLWVQLITSAKWDGSVSIPGGLISWRVSGDEVITWRMEASADGWIGLGWDPSDGKMENADMVILSTKDNRLSMGDYFSYSMSLPEKDRSQDFDIIDFGKSDGKTYMEFSRPLVTEDSRTDKPITLGTMTAIWAYGNNRNGISYHGTNRGSVEVTITIPQKQSSSSEMVVAEFDGGSIHWRVEGDSVFFHVEAKTGGWLGVGFDPDDGKMTNADMVILTGSDEKIRVRDFYSAGMMEPVLDSSQDIEVVHMGRKKGVTFMDFRRLINTADNEQDKVLTATTTVIWAYGPGKSVSYHQNNRGSMVLDLVTPTVSGVDSAKTEDVVPVIENWGDNQFSFPAGTLYWRPEIDQITIRVESESSGWFGLGFKPDDGKMLNADMVLATGDKQIGDYFSEGMELPTEDDQNDLVAASTGSTDGKTWLQFTRKYDTKDDQDKPILFGENVYIIYAWGTDSSVNYHSGNRGHFLVTLVTEANVINPDDALYTRNPDGTFDRDGEVYEKVIGQYYKVNDDGYAPVNNYFVKYGQVYLFIDGKYKQGTKDGFYLQDGLYWKNNRGFGYDGHYYYELNSDGYYTKSGYLWKDQVPHTFSDGKYYTINSDGYSYHDGFYWREKDRYGKKGDTYILCNEEGFYFFEGYWWKDDKRYLLVNGRYFRS